MKQTFVFLSLCLIDASRANQLPDMAAGNCHLLRWTKVKLPLADGQLLSRQGKHQPH